MSIHHQMNRLSVLQAAEPCFSTETILALDEAGCVNQAAEAQYDALGIPAALIPKRDGGAMDSMPELMRLLGALGRRDLALALGYVMTGFMAATNVWLAGSPAQRQRLADLLRRNGKMSIAYHELEHGNDFAGNAVRAVRAPGGYLISGQKTVINNIERADALVLHARTAEAKGPRSHSLFFIDKKALNPSQFEILPRYPTQGVRGCQIAGVRFDDCFIPEDSLLGGEGEAFACALRAFQITRALLPGASLACVGFAMGLTADYVRSRRLYGGVVLDLPHARATLSEAWIEFLLAESLSEAAARGLHVIPGEMSVLASACKFFVPQRMRAALKRLALLLGSRSYIREGEAALFEKIMRDYPVVSVGHASSLSCLASVIPQLPLIFRKFGAPNDEAPATLAALLGGGALPDLDFEALRLTSGGRDLLFNSALHWPGLLEVRREEGRIESEACEKLRIQVIALRHECQRLSESVIEAESVAAFDIAERYAWLIAAMAATGRWLHGQAADQSPAVLSSVLSFVLRRLDGDPFQTDAAAQDVLIAHMDSRLGRAPYNRD